jgi:hypothetical protein
MKVGHRSTFKKYIGWVECLGALNSNCESAGWFLAFSYIFPILKPSRDIISCHSHNLERHPACSQLKKGVKMPHLQEKNEVEESTPTINRKSPKRESKGLPIMAATEKQSLAVKRDSYDSDESEQESSSRKQVITPSPYGTSSPLSPKRKKGPLLSIFGSTRLFSSPISVKKRVSVDEEDKKDSSGEEPASDGRELGQPKNLRYGRKHVLPTAQSLSFDKVNKRQLGKTDSGLFSKKAKTEGPESTKSQEEATTSVPKKKPIISPTSSGEKVDDDESTGTLSRGAAYPFHGRPHPHFHHRFPHYPPPHHAYGGPYPPFGPGYPVYSGYPHSPNPHSHFGAPPSAYYPHYPPRHNMMSPFRSGHRGLPMKASMGMNPMNTKERKGQPQLSTSSSSSAPNTGESKDNTIASVADWQRAAVADGSPPSAKRCVPLTEPIPSKFWG